MLKGIYFESEEYDTLSQNKIVRFVRTDDTILDIKISAIEATQLVNLFYKQYGKKEIEKISLDRFGHLPGDFPLAEVSKDE